MKKINKKARDIALKEMRELIDMVIKYSPRQLAIMAKSINISELQADMRKRDATREELMTAGELAFDIVEEYPYIIDEL